MSVWQSEEQLCACVLREVFAWLDARALARAGAACRAWRRAAAERSLWRRLLLRHAPPRTARALPLHHAPAPAPWRREYVTARAAWRLAARHRAAAALLHAAPEPGGPRLALAAADAGLALWARGGAGAGWRELWRTSLRGRGWGSVARVQWAGSPARLLLAGPLALVDDWELLVLRIEEDGSCGAVTSRVRCSAGAAGCWADAAGNAFLSLELRRLGFGIYCTTVWLNSATQEMQSEYAGVTSPLLRVYNEDGAHITHALVVDAPDEDYAAAPDEYEHEEEDGPGLAYLRAIEPTEMLRPFSGSRRMLVLGGGCRIGAWAFSSPRPPPLVATDGGGLAERVRRHRARRDAPDEDAPAPLEASVRAVCTAPAHTCRLAAPLVGLALHERGRCLWAVCSDGSATCVSVALRVLCRVRAPGGGLGGAPAGLGGAPAGLGGAPAGLAGAHYVQPAASHALLAWPAGAYSRSVLWCAAQSCARGAALAHGAPAVCCVLPPHAPHELLVLAGDELYVWESRATPQREPRHHD